MSPGQAQALAQVRDVATASRAVQLLTTLTLVDAEGWLQLGLSLDCAGTPHSPNGLKLRRRERFVVRIPPDFPFVIPHVAVPHRRWAGIPHVQWGSLLCLYAAPSVEWVPADGMFGLLDRLSVWLERASLGELDPDDQPLHPPVAYTKASETFLIVRADIGSRAPAAQITGRKTVLPHREVSRIRTLLAIGCSWVLPRPPVLTGLMLASGSRQTSGCGGTWIERSPHHRVAPAYLARSPFSRATR